MTKKSIPKLTLAAVNASTGNLPRGCRRPLRVVPSSLTAAVKDADGRTLFETSLAVANMMVIAFNAHPKLCAADAANMAALLALRTRLRNQDRTPAIADMLAIVDVALAETDDDVELELL